MNLTIRNISAFNTGLWPFFFATRSLWLDAKNGHRRVVVWTANAFLARPGSQILKHEAKVSGHVLSRHLPSLQSKAWINGYPVTEPVQNASPC